MGLEGVARELRSCPRLKQRVLRLSEVDAQLVKRAGQMADWIVLVEFGGDLWICGLISEKLDSCQSRDLEEFLVAA